MLLCIERLLCSSVTNIDLGATFPSANMVQGKNTLGYLRTRTFYTPERKYTYKYASITKCLTYSPSRNVKKNLLISTLTSDQNVRPNSWTWRVLTQICRTFWEEYVGPESMIVDTLGVYCMLIFRHIFLSNYWWQKSDIWSQASYRYPISWEALTSQIHTSCLPKSGGIIGEH